jgi:hypothetical protein
LIYTHNIISLIFYLFSTNETANGKYIGIGTSSNNILRCSVVVPVDCVASKMVFSIKQLTNNITYYATLYVNGVMTNFKSCILDGSLSYTGIANNNIKLHQSDLISIKIEYNSDIILSNGVCISLYTTI